MRMCSGFGWDAAPSQRFSQASRRECHGSTNLRVCGLQNPQSAIRNPQLSCSPIHLPQHNIHAPQDDHRISHRLAEAHVFKYREVDERWRPNSVAIRIRTAVADEVKTDLTFRPFDSAIRFSSFRAEAAQLPLRIHDRAGGEITKRGLEDIDRLAHLQDANHVAVIGVTVIAERYPEI